MKILLLYFTGTGVTAKYALDLAQGFEKLNHEVETRRLKKKSEIQVDGFDIIGIGAPAYSYRAPRLATRLIRKINLQKKPFFVFCTCGGGPGNTNWNLYRAAKKTGSVCLGQIIGVGLTNLRNWMPKKKNTPANLRGLNPPDCQEARNFAPTIIKRLNIYEKSTDIKQRKNWKPKANLFLVIWGLFLTWGWQMALMGGIKFVDKSKCTRCKLCATKICPSGAIKLTKKNTPIFVESRCVGCSGCLNLCPEDAIWTLRTRNKIQYKKYSKYILKNE